MLIKTSEIKKKFKENNIPYDDIDKDMRELIYVLNFKANLKTKFCCFGHKISRPAYVIFDESVTDKKIEGFCLYLYHRGGESSSLKFYKWLRSSGAGGDKILKNWLMKIDVPNINNLSMENFVKADVINNIVGLLL